MYLREFRRILTNTSTGFTDGKNDVLVLITVPLAQARTVPRYKLLIKSQQSAPEKRDNAMQKK